jgi:hypothetical protein
LQSPSTCKRTEIQGKDEIRGSSRKSSLRQASSSDKLPRSFINIIEKPSSLKKSQVVIPTFSYANSPPVTKRSIIKPQRKDVQVIFNTKVVHSSSSSPFLTPPPPIPPCCVNPSQHFGNNYFIVPSSNLLPVSPPLSHSHLCPHRCWQGNFNKGCACLFIPPPSLSPLSHSHSHSTSPNATAASLNYPNSQPISVEPPREILTDTTTSLHPHQSHSNADESLSLGEKRCLNNNSPNMSSPILQNSTLSAVHVRMETEAQIIKEYQKLMELRAQELVFRDMQKQLEASLAQMNQTQV